MFTLLWLQHQHLSWTFPLLEAADTPSFDSLGGGGTASSPLLSFPLMDVLTSGSLSDSQWAAHQREGWGNDEKCKEADKHRGCGLITSTGVVEPGGLKALHDCKLPSNTYDLLQLHFSTLSIKNHSWHKFGNTLQRFKTLIVIYWALVFDCWCWPTASTTI